MSPLRHDVAGHMLYDHEVMSADWDGEAGVDQFTGRVFHSARWEHHAVAG